MNKNMSLLGKQIFDMVNAMNKVYTEGAAVINLNTHLKDCPPDLQRIVLELYEMKKRNDENAAAAKRIARFDPNETEMFSNISRLYEKASNEIHRLMVIYERLLMKGGAA
jgi:hypothetical protein